VLTGSGREAAFFLGFLEKSGFKKVYIVIITIQINYVRINRFCCPITGSAA
jgi:hypothetical protein